MTTQSATPYQNVTEDIDPEGRKLIRYSLPMAGMGAVRQSQRDRWRPSPAVARYRSWKDELRLRMRNWPAEDEIRKIGVLAYYAIPSGWSDAKKRKHLVQPKRTKPDWDNVYKAVTDALWDHDQKIPGGYGEKMWHIEDRLIIEIVLRGENDL